MSTDLRDVIALAQKMDARMMELRAKQGSGDEPRMILSEIYNWFTEGFDTAELKDARASLEELSA